MKNIMIALMALLVTAVSTAQVSIYSKGQHNLKNKWQYELGLSKPVWSEKKWEADVYFGGVGQDPLTKNSPITYTAGATLRWNADPNISFYTQTSHDLVKTWSQETGMGVRLIKKYGFDVGSNLGYQTSYPYKKGGNWVLGVTVSRSF